MKRKIVPVVLVVSVLCLSLIGAAQAGSTLDFGQLVGLPAVGSVNFYAWDRTTELSGGVPSTIITEDSFNSSQGYDGGYFYNTNTAVGPEGPTWAVITYNLTHDYLTTRNIAMIFGGIGPSTQGTVWDFDFWFTTNPSIKNWGIIGTPHTGSPLCPSREPVTIDVNGDRLVSFFAQPAQTYHIYRSQNASGANNGYSNGIYYHIGTATTDEFGHGVYRDTTYSIYASQWYEIVQVNSTGINGCHSEPVVPTVIEISDFQAVYDDAMPQVNLSWNTLSETNILGFNLYRSEGLDGARTQLNSELIPASQSGSPDGNAYSPLADTALEPGSTLYYWLEVIHLNGASPAIVQSDPVSVPSVSLKIYLPLIQH
jgi:hypothetical protein